MPECLYHVILPFYIVCKQNTVIFQVEEEDKEAEGSSCEKRRKHKMTSEIERFSTMLRPPL